MKEKFQLNWVAGNHARISYFDTNIKVIGMRGEAEMMEDWSGECAQTTCITQRRGGRGKPPPHLAAHAWKDTLSVWVNKGTVRGHPHFNDIFSKAISTTFESIHILLQYFTMRLCGVLTIGQSVTIIIII